MPACRSRTGFICRRNGQKTRPAARKHVFPRRSRSRLNRRSRWSRSARPMRRACRAKYWLATVEKNISFRALVDLAKMRWRVERDYLELKQEVGLGHYEGRGWPGFHHHGTLCIAVYGFLISEREMIPPSGPHCAGKLKKPAIPDSCRPRGAADPAPTSRSQLDRHAASTLDRRDRKNAAKMSILRKQIQKEQAPCFLTQYN